MIVNGLILMKRLCPVLSRYTEFKADFQQHHPSESIYMRRSLGKKRARYLKTLTYLVVMVGVMAGVMVGAVAEAVAGANHEGDYRNTHQDTTLSKVKQTLLLLSGF